MKAKLDEEKTSNNQLHN